MTGEAVNEAPMVYTVRPSLLARIPLGHTHEVMNWIDNDPGSGQGILTTFFRWHDGQKILLEPAQDRPDLCEVESTVGHRWGKEKGNWRLKSEDAIDDSPLASLLTFLDDREDVLSVEFSDFPRGTTTTRSAPVRYVQTSGGRHRSPRCSIRHLLDGQIHLRHGVGALRPSLAVR
jgi:hypothetical protein